MVMHATEDGASTNLSSFLAFLIRFYSLKYTSSDSRWRFTLLSDPQFALCRKQSTPFPPHFFCKNINFIIFFGYFFLFIPQAPPSKFDKNKNLPYILYQREGMQLLCFSTLLGRKISSIGVQTIRSQILVWGIDRKY